MNYPRLFTLCFCLLVSSASIAQKVSNIRAEAKGNLVIIFYDLAGGLPGQVFDVTLFSSYNNMETPLEYVMGEVGAGVLPGQNKKIEWGAKKELANFEGELKFEIRAKLTFSPIAISTPHVNTVFRRGKSYNIGWQGGIQNENMKLELYQDSVQNMVIGQTDNKGGYIWVLPYKVKPGKNYRLKISSARNPQNYNFSSDFAIKRKIPTAVKIAPLVILAGVGIMILPKQIANGGEREPDDILPPTDSTPGGKKGDFGTSNACITFTSIPVQVLFPAPYSTCEGSGKHCLYEKKYTSAVLFYLFIQCLQFRSA